MICQYDIIGIKEDLSQNLGRRIIVKGNAGRSKTYEEEVVLDKMYPNHFTVKRMGNLNNSYKYTDILTKTIEVSLYDGKEYSPLEVHYVIDNKPQKNSYK